MDNFHEINVENLLYKIEEFYKRFYFNKLLKGIIFFFAIILSIFLVFDLIFYYGDLSDLVRFGIFYIFLFSVLSGVYYWIVDPILRLLKINRGLTLEEASQYIGGYYSDIGDKLLNTIQFYNSGDKDLLVMAAMEQRAGSLSKFNFTEAVPNLQSNRFIFYALIPITFFIGIFIFNTKLITEGSNRLINYDVNYAAIAPFSINVLNGNIIAIKGDDIEIRVDLKGKNLPSELDLVINGAVFRMNHIDNGLFSYVINDVYVNGNYHISSGKFLSDNFSITLLDDIFIEKIYARILYPKYLNKKDLKVDNPNMLNVPYGSKIIWNVKSSKHTEASLVWNDSRSILDVDNSGNSTFTQMVISDVNYEVDLVNDLGDTKLGFYGEVNVTEDRYPVISVISKVDENDEITVYFGKIQDDYGFKDLVVRLSQNDSIWYENLDLDRRVLNDVFSYVLDSKLLRKSTEITFIVRDNDALNGYKKSESEKFMIDILSNDERKDELDKNRNEIVEDVEELLAETNGIDKKLNDLKKDLLNERELSWESKKELENVLKEAKEREKTVQNLNERLKNYQKKSNLNDPKTDKELLDKQKQLNELFDKLMDEETKKLLDELQKLLEQVDKKKIQEHLEKMEMNNEDLKKELDLNLEIFKQMEFEREFNKVIDELEKLSEEQTKLSKETNKEKNREELLNKQDSLNEQFDEFKDDLKKLDSLNKELNDPNKMDVDSAGLDAISKEQKNAKENLEKEKLSESSDNQKKAAEMMKKMKEGLEAEMEMDSSEQEGEDMEALRKILENLLVLSFEQESLMMELKSIDRNDPRVIGINQDQKDMIESSEMVKDSLMSLAVRVFQLNDIIQDEVGVISKEMNRSVEELQERRFSETLLHQQKSLTAINNLAVLLDEVIQQMQEQQSKQKESNGSCTKPGQGKPKPSMKGSKMKQGELAKKIEQLKKELEKGNKPGKMNPGKVGSGMSKEIAQMAAQQEMIRREVQKLAEELKKEGGFGEAGELKKLEELLEKNEEDIINFNLDNDFFMRQQDIEIKMLEAENAKRKRDQDNKRESEEAVNIIDYKDLKLDIYKLEQEFELELLRIFNPSMSIYYKSQVQLYNLNSR
jgi:hypothetical protein